MDAIAALGLKLKPLIAQIVGFLILFWLLKKFLFGRIADMTRTRADEIKGAYEENEKTREEVRALKAQYEKDLREIQDKASAIIQDATKKADQSSQAILEKARQEVNQLRERGLAEIEYEKKKAIAEIRSEVVNLSILLTSKIIEKSIDRATAEKLADDVISGIGGTTS